MEYIEKEIYVNIDNKNIVQYEYLSNTNKICGKFIRVSDNHFQSNLEEHPGNFTKERLKLATPEEKHWLKTCIKLDKFITFDEAMESFIPEYVECILPKYWKQTIQENNGNLIFKSDFKSTCVVQIKDRLLNKTQNSFKPSTKEAYDAQFVIKEPEFILPDTWYISVNNQEEVPYYKKYFTKSTWLFKNNYIYGYNNGVLINGDKNGKKLTFEQFKKYVLKEETIEEKVIEPLSQFKIIETIETITKVENNEGNQFFIDDSVTPIDGNNKGFKCIIESFKRNKTNTSILAITNLHKGNGININNIEHYIEPKVVEPEFILPEKWCIKSNNEEELLTVLKFKPITDCKDSTSLNFYRHFPTLNNDCTCYRTIQNGYTEITFDQFKKYVLKETKKVEIKLPIIGLNLAQETLLEKAKRLYPIGTKIYSAKYPEDKYKSIVEGYGDANNEILCLNKYGNTSCHLYFNNTWAEIIEYPHGFKIGDKIKLKYGINNVYYINKIEGNQLIFETNSLPKINSMLAKNAIKVN